MQTGMRHRYAHADEYAVFGYTLVSPAVGAPDAASVHWVSVAVIASNVAPIPVDVEVALGTATNGTAVLSAEDPDGSLAGRVQYRITAFPRVGTLRQASGEPISAGCDVM